MHKHLLNILGIIFLAMPGLYGMEEGITSPAKRQKIEESKSEIESIFVTSDDQPITVDYTKKPYSLLKEVNFSVPKKWFGTKVQFSMAEWKDFITLIQEKQALIANLSAENAQQLIDYFKSLPIKRLASFFKVLVHLTGGAKLAHLILNIEVKIKVDNLEPVAISKIYLSVSDYFTAMLDGSFKEKTADYIQLKSTISTTFSLPAEEMQTCLSMLKEIYLMRALPAADSNLSKKIQAFLQKYKPLKDQLLALIEFWQVDQDEFVVALIHGLDLDKMSLIHKQTPKGKKKKIDYDPNKVVYTFKGAQITATIDEHNIFNINKTFNNMQQKFISYPNNAFKIASSPEKTIIAVYSPLSKTVRVYNLALYARTPVFNDRAQQALSYIINLEACPLSVKVNDKGYIIIQETPNKISIWQKFPFYVQGMMQLRGKLTTFETTSGRVNGLFWDHTILENLSNNIFILTECLEGTKIQIYAPTDLNNLELRFTFTIPEAFTKLCSIAQFQIKKIYNNMVVLLIQFQNEPFIRFYDLKTGELKTVLINPFSDSDYTVSIEKGIITKNMLIISKNKDSYVLSDLDEFLNPKVQEEQRFISPQEKPVPTSSQGKEEI